MEDDKKIARVPYDPTLPVNTAWDLGVSDHTAIIFFQQKGTAVNIIDYYEERGQGLPHYIQIINEKDYIYKDHFAPHDIEVTDFSNGKTRREVAYQLRCAVQGSAKNTTRGWNPRNIHDLAKNLYRCRPLQKIDRCVKTLP
jgi:hypothetical protein